MMMMPSVPFQSHRFRLYLIYSHQTRVFKEDTSYFVSVGCQSVDEDDEKQERKILNAVMVETIVAALLVVYNLFVSFSI